MKDFLVSPAAACRSAQAFWSVAALSLMVATPAAAQVSVTPSAPALRLLCVSTTGVLSYDGNSNTTCAGPQTNLTGLTVSNGGGFVASGTAGFAATGSGGVTTASGNITTATGNISATAGTVQGATLTDGIATISGGDIAGVGTLTASIGNIGTVNATTIVNSGSATTGSLTVNGATTTNGITNTGNIQTSILTATGAVSAASVTAGSVAATTVSATTVAATNVNATAVNATNVSATTVAATTVNATSVNVSGNTTTASLSVGAGGLAVASGAPVNMGGNRVQNVATPVAPTDAANKAYVDSRLGASDGRIDSAFDRIEENEEGIAIAVALGGLTLPAGKDFAIGANLGFYGGKEAMAAQTAIKLTDNLILNGGIGVGLEETKVGGRIGFMAAW